MKKLSLFALAAVTLAACDAPAPTPEDFNAIQTEIQQDAATNGVTQIVALGTSGDYVIALPETDVLREIANKKQTVAFMSIDNPAQYVTEGKCLLNIIPDNTMQMMGTPENKCGFRLFCGTADDMNNNQFYAVEVCSE